MKSNEEIFGIIDYINSLSFSEFELETDDLKIRIKRVSSAYSNNNIQFNSNEPVAQAAPPQEQPKEDNKPCVLAPLTGVYYQAPSPGEKPFISVGDLVAEGDTICILEAMKNMIEVKSDQSGRVEKILGVDGEAVDEGDAIVIFEGE